MLIPQRFDVDHHGQRCYRPGSWCIYCDAENMRLHLDSSVADGYTVDVASLPSTKQMLQRANSGHIAYLRACQDDTSVPGADSMTASSLRGWRTVRATLVRWECIDGDTVTQRGADLLSAWDERAMRA